MNSPSLPQSSPNARTDAHARPTHASHTIAMHRFDGAAAEALWDDVAVEEPLDIRIAEWTSDGIVSRTAAITMRTPGADADLALGFLVSEGIVHTRDDVADVRHCGTDDAPQPNVIKVTLRPGARPDWNRLQRHVYTSSSCGVCGKTSIEAVFEAARDCRPLWSNPPLSPDVLLSFPAALRQVQATFFHTGGLHAAGLFDGTGALVSCAEDVGRHNAVDKLVGAAFRAGTLPLSDHALMLSGRASFELLQKAAMAGIPVVAAVGAPSSLAVEAAREMGMTLVGFLRDGRFNVYAEPSRVALPAPPIAAAGSTGAM